jgi:hypothetical protein
VKRLGFISTFCCALVVSVAGTASADDLYPELIGDIIVLDTGVTTNAGGVSVAFNSVDDEYRVAWFDSRIPGQNDVYAQRVSTAGDLLGDNVPVIVGWETQIDTAIAHSPVDNQYFITWRYQGGDPGTPGFNHTYGGLASATGGLIQTPFDVASAGLEATLAYNSADNEYFLEARNFAGGGTPGIYGQRIDSSGSLIGRELTISTVGAPAPAGQVAYNSNDNQYLATWRDQVAADLKGRIINADGTFATSSFVISSVFPESSLAATVAFVPSDNRYLVVFGTFSGGPMYGQFVGADGTLDGDAFVVVTGTERVYPFMAFDPVNAVFLVAWQNGDLGSANVQLVGTDGTLLGDPLEIVGHSVWDMARVAADTNSGGFIVTFVDRSGYPTDVAVVGQLVGVGGGEPCDPDLDDDGDVDLSDLATLLAHYDMTSGVSCEDGDIDEDGDVDLADLAALLAAYGTTP